MHLPKVAWLVNGRAKNIPDLLPSQAALSTAEMNPDPWMGFKKSKTQTNNVYVKFHVHRIWGGEGPKLSLDFQRVCDPQNC